MDRSTRLMVLALAALIAGTVLVLPNAHHGWRWAENENSEITGTIKSVRLGNPHGEMTILVNGARNGRRRSVSPGGMSRPV